MKKTIAIAFLAVAAMEASQAVREINIGQDVSMAGVNVGGQGQAAITINSLGEVYVRVGASVPQLLDQGGDNVRITGLRTFPAGLSGVDAVSVDKAGVVTVCVGVPVKYLRDDAGRAVIVGRVVRK